MKKIIKPIYAACFAFLFFTSCNGQMNTTGSDSVGKPATHSEGLPKMTKTQGSDVYDNVHCSIRDAAGNLWFGTTGDGIFRYDGTSFINFTTENGLSSNTVWSVLEDNAGNIWIGTDSGVCRYDGKTMSRVPILGTSVSYTQPYNASRDTPSGRNEVFSLMQDKSGIIWFGTTHGVFCYDGTSFTRFLDNRNIVNSNGLQLKSVQCMLEDREGNIWLGSGPMAFEGLCCYDGKTLTNFKPNGDEWIRYLIEDKNGVIWIGTRSQGVWCYEEKVLTKFRDGDDMSLTTKDIGLSAMTDKTGNLWFSGGEADNGYGGKGGIWRYDGESFTNFTVKDGLGDYSVWSLVEDNTGNIWVGTRNSGLYRFDGTSFTSFSE